MLWYSVYYKYVLYIFVLKYNRLGSGLIALGTLFRKMNNDLMTINGRDRSHDAFYYAKKQIISSSQKTVFDLVLFIVFLFQINVPVHSGAKMCFAKEGLTKQHLVSV